MTRSLKKYIETGEPILVKTENGLLMPYELTKRDLSGESSIENHNTENLFNSCLERILGEPFNPLDFIKESRERIWHYGCTMGLKDLFDSESEEIRYLRVSGRIHRELDYEEGKSQVYIKKWSEMSQFEKDEEMKLNPLPKIDYAWSLLNAIKCAAQSDAIGFRQKLRGERSNELVLYEIKFVKERLTPGIDLYLPKPLRQ